MWFNALHHLAGWLGQRQAQRSPGRKRQKWSFVPRLEAFEDRLVPSTLTVLNTLDKGAGSLRDAITKASSGDSIVFAPSLNGQTITLTSDQLTINKNLDIEGPGASLLAISGNGTNRVFNIPEGNSVTIAGLTITQGLGSGSGGGGVFVAVSTLALTNDVFSYNQAVFGGNSPACGGALNILNGANTMVSDCTFLDNVASGQGSDSGSARGGAIQDVDNPVNSSTLIIENSTFIGNEAIGGKVLVEKPGKSAGVAQGGAIDTTGPASLTVTNCTFSGNMAIAGTGGSGAGSVLLDVGLGGAIHDVQTTLVVSGSTFTNNQALGGSDATVGAASSGYVGLADGGALSTQIGPATVANSVFYHNLAQGGSGNSGGGGSINVGWGVGGAVGNFFTGTTLVASNDIFCNNLAAGGAGNGGGLLTGDGIGGGLANVGGAVATLNNCTFINDQAIGGARSHGADGLGGAFANIQRSVLTASGCMLSGNQAIGSGGGSGANSGNGFGGGLYNDETSTLAVAGSTITANSAIGGAAGGGGSDGQGIGGGCYFAAGGSVCLDTETVVMIFGNTSSSSDNDIFGSYTIC